MSGLVSVRKTILTCEDVCHDGGPAIERPLRKAAIAAVVRNPYAGRHVKDLSQWMQALDGLAEQLTDRLLDVVGYPRDAIESFGKGAIVGTDGEGEHGACWHAPGGGALKRALGVKGFVSASEFVGGTGSILHIPLVSVHSPWVRSHFDGIGISAIDAPRPQEILFALAVSTGARVHARIGGLTFEEGARGEGPRF